MLDKVRGGLFGVAVGDALGATFEFMTREEILSRHGSKREMVGGGWLGLKPGEVTDDTEMTLCVARGIIASPQDPVEEIGRQFMSWYQTDPKDVGSTIRTALGAYTETGDWEKARAITWERHGGKVAGNGCLMRTLPFSFVYFQSPDLLGKFSRETAFLTHPDPLAAEACHFYNVLAVGLLLGEEPWSAFKKARSLLQHEELARRLDSWPSLAVQDLRPTGYVVDSLEAALWCFFNGENIIEAIESAVNLGGDADTVAAICGGLAGTYWGWSALPDGWKSRLLIKEELEQLAAALLQASGQVS
ncbi:MAG: ADP-ribosyl-[dinitrogen reductase] hydrolase [Firmicutes bacterium]|jgi:ADP-ribosyl-[dinitrogen reductase] hydrolase|nr:ADP-ribosyl-[dinitrogen reductase] hydrolase [Bacillota bacterium]